jgi:hypothetical protein
MSAWQKLKAPSVPAADCCALEWWLDRARQKFHTKLLGLTLAVWVTLAVVGNACAQQPNEISARLVATELDARKETIAAEITTTLRTSTLKTSYTTVWRNYEDAAIEALCEFLPQHVPGLTEKHLDRGKTGHEKNRMADLAIWCGTNVIEISIKAARKSANPENDLGTFHDRPVRQKLLTDSFTLWVRYDDSASAIKCDRVFFDRSWRFVGKSSLVDGVKYRKKDGNLRPKPWAMFESGEAFWKTETQFEAAVNRAEAFRANELVKEHLQNLSEEDQRLLYERLREKFSNPSPPTP